MRRMDLGLVAVAVLVPTLFLASMYVLTVSQTVEAGRVVISVAGIHSARFTIPEGNSSETCYTNGTIRQIEGAKTDVANGTFTYHISNSQSPRTVLFTLQCREPKTSFSYVGVVDEKTVTLPTGESTVNMKCFINDTATGA